MKTKQELLEGLSELLTNLKQEKTKMTPDPEPGSLQPPKNVLTPKELDFRLRKFIKNYDLWPHAPRIIPFVWIKPKATEMNIAFIDSFSDKEIKTIDELWEKLTS